MLPPFLLFDAHAVLSLMTAPIPLFFAALFAHLYTHNPSRSQIASPLLNQLGFC